MKLGSATVVRGARSIAQYTTYLFCESFEDCVLESSADFLITIADKLTLENGGLKFCVERGFVWVEIMVQYGVSAQALPNIKAGEKTLRKDGVQSY
ncbi:MAG: hypothetical protein DMF69_20510 [Acidobacteria bacterium]|nr:MAG: hypothetical protein DMF69_20510 [Acidobacteriota bacterium]